MQGFVSHKILRRKCQTDLPLSEPHYILQQNALVLLVKHIPNLTVYDCCSFQITDQWVRSTLAMATASVPVEPNEEECSVCHEQFTEPKLLPCGHLLCRHCLLSWLKSQLRQSVLSAAAPSWNQRSGEAKSLEDIADGFPTDLAMAALVEADRLLNKGHNCCVCENVAATSFCLNCGDMLCSTCKKGHGKLSATRHHTVEELSSLTPDKIAANRPATCAVHADKTCELFCPTHGVSICHVCATSRHRSCPEVKDLEEKVEEARAVLAELAAMLSAGETELGTAISQLDQHLRETEKRTRAAIAEMEATCDRLESAIKACRRRLKQLTETAVSDVKEAVHAGKTCLLQRRGKLTSHKRVVERVPETKSCDIVTEMTSVMKTRVHDLDFSVSLPADAKVVSMVTLVIDPEAVAVVERMLAELGQVKVVPADVAATKQVYIYIYQLFF